MKSTYELYNLIAKMDKSERGYFKKYAYKGGQKENEYLKLYEYVVKNVQKYDMDVLEEKCKKKFGQTKSFASVKNYLFELILQVLVEYHKPNKKMGDLFEQYQKGMVLVEKGLFEKGLRTMEATIDRAFEKEDFSISLEVSSKLPGLYLRLNQAHKIKPIIEKRELIIRMQKQLIDLENVVYQFYGFCTEGRIRNDEKRKKVDTVLSNIDTYEALLSNRAKFCFQEIHSMDAWMRANYKKTFDTYLAKIKILETNNFLSLNKTDIIREYRGLVQTATSLGKFDVAEQYLQKLAALKNAKSSRFEDYQMITLFYLRLRLYNKTNALGKSDLIIQSAQEYFDKKGVTLDTFVIGTIYESITASLYLEKYDQMLYWVNLYESQFGKIAEMQYKIETKLMSIIAHYELENFDLLPYQIRNFKRFLEKKSDKYEFELILLKNINLAFKAKTKKELNQVYSETINVFEKEKSQAFKTFLSCFDVISWLTAKIENRSFREVYYETIQVESNVK